MMHYLEEWMARKGGRPQVSIREKRSIRFRFTRPPGPRGQFAVVHLTGEPATGFSFKSIAEWPSPECDWTSAVLDGILDELFATDLGRVAAKVHFTLEQVECHAVDSCAAAFYHAARGAVRDILGRDRYPGNIAY
jgi:hypothetical protein